MWFFVNLNWGNKSFLLSSLNPYQQIIYNAIDNVSPIKCQTLRKPTSVLLKNRSEFEEGKLKMSFKILFLVIANFCLLISALPSYDSKVISACQFARTFINECFEYWCIRCISRTCCSRIKIKLCLYVYCVLERIIPIVYWWIVISKYVNDLSVTLSLEIIDSWLMNHESWAKVLLAYFACAWTNFDRKAIFNIHLRPTSVRTMYTITYCICIEQS